jgi:hypothetical protein
LAPKAWSEQLALPPANLPSPYTAAAKSQQIILASQATGSQQEITRARIAQRALSVLTPRQCGFSM